MFTMSKAERDIKRKLRVFQYAEKVGDISRACRHFGISRQSFYDWKRRYERDGEQGLINYKPCPENPSVRATTPEAEEKILYLRRTYHLGPDRICWYMKRYHPDLATSESTTYRVLRRHGMNRLPRNAKRRTVQTHRYEKQVPGHHIQMDVKFLTLRAEGGRRIKRYQYTAVDDATRIRALRVYPRHNQVTAIKFVEYVVRKFPFRIHTIRTDNGHEWQAKFHWHVEDLGIRHEYIKPRRPNLNGKVERSHLTDDIEFYQLLDYADDVDLNEKLKEWEDFYNYQRPHASHRGKTPYEVLRERLSGKRTVSLQV
jgi:transposase InsO family protein